MFDQKIDVGHRTTQNLRSLPAAAREVKVDQNLEVGPVQLLDYCASDSNGRSACFFGFNENGLRHCIDAPKQIVRRFHTADGLSVGGDLSQF